MSIIILTHFLFIIASSCSSNQFQCVEGHCIDLKNRCNEVQECLDGSDEFLCCESNCLLFLLVHVHSTPIVYICTYYMHIYITFAVSEVVMSNNGQGYSVQAKQVHNQAHYIALPV